MTASSSVAKPAALESDDPPWSTAIAAAMLVPPVLVLIYWGSAWLVQSREAISTAMVWEPATPLVPWMIIPYLSLDPMLVLTPCVCRSRWEAGRLAIALLGAGVFAGGCFVAFPTTVPFGSPAVGGVLYDVYQLLNRSDVRSNALPSLHAALAVVLWIPWARHTAWPVKWAVHVWFGLLLTSTVLTHQHSIADALAGTVLGAGCGIIFLRRRSG